MAYARLTSYPPLSLLTVIPSGQDQIPVTALLEWSNSRPDFPFEVVLCYTASSSSSKHPSLWSTSPLQKCKNPYHIEHEHAFRSTFQTTLLRSSITSNDALHFTFKYRINPGAPWKWVQAQDGTRHGQLILQSPENHVTADLKTFLELDSNWTLSRLPSADLLRPVFKLESRDFIKRSDQGMDEAMLTTLAVGKVKGQLQYMALVRGEPYWLQPRQGTDFFYLAEDAILCSFLTTSGKVLTIITLTGIDETYSVLQSNERGQVVVAARCDSDKDIPFHALVSVGNTFEESSAAAIAAARDIVNVQPQIQDLASCIPPSVSRSAMDPRNEQWLDGLAFCTWNALGQDLTESKILSALDTLTKNKIKISTLLIDDNWQVLGPIKGHDYADSFFRGFSDLCVNSSVAPEGFSALVQRIRSSFPQINNIGLWHALFGYWGGISPDGQIARDYQTIVAPNLLMGNIPVDMTCIAPTSLQKFYDDFYSYLAQSGITFIKTDVQHMVSTLRSRSSRRAMISAYQTTWTSAHLTHFHGKAISCMSQTPETLWSSLLQTCTPPVVHRNSDDFYPEVSASHPWHIWTNAHNALFTMHLNVVPDWDMFQTKHEFSAYHAAARCISGGPILITDTPGEHDLGLIQQMTAIDTTGRSVALRPQFARTSRVFDEYTDGNILKVGTTTKAGCSLLGLWNIAEKDVSTFVALSEFLNARSIGERVIVRSFRSGQIFGPFETGHIEGGVSTESLIYTSIPVREWDILTMYPVTKTHLAGQEIEIAVLGLIDKMSGAAGILNSSTTTSGSNSILTKLELKALGKAGIWISVPSSLAVKDQKFRLVHPKGGQDIPSARADTVLLKGAQNNTHASMIVIDVEAEWTQRELFGSEQENIRLEFEFSIR